MSKESLLENIDANFLIETANCAGWQIDDENSFVLTTFGEMIELKPCSLLAMKRKLDLIDLSKLFEEDMSDVEVIRLGCINRVFVWTLQEVVEIKNFITSLFNVLELNSEVNSSLRLH